MRLIDPTKKHVTREHTKYGHIARREHWNGTLDANVKLKALRLHLTAGAPPDTRLVQAVAELEAAQAEWLIAKHSPDPAWVAYAHNRVRVAKEKVGEAS